MAGDFAGRTVVVTGGTGALGSAVLDRLLDEGAICHVPTSHASRPAKLPSPGMAALSWHRRSTLSDAASVEAFYESVPDLWASIHVAGAFAMSPVGEAAADAFTEMMDANAKTAFFCCSAAARAMLATGTAGRIVNVTARAGLDPRKGAGDVRLYGEQGGGCGDHRRARRGAEERRHPRSMRWRPRRSIRRRTARRCPRPISPNG